MAAIPAVAIDASHPGDTDASSHWQSFGCSLDHLAHNLVAGNQFGKKRRQITFDDVQIGAANTAGLHTEQEIARCRLGAGHVFDREKMIGRRSGGVEDGSFDRPTSFSLNSDRHAGSPSA